MSLLAVSLALFCCPQQPSAPAPPPPLRGVETWSGFLYRNEEGAIQLGSAVVAMGVMGRAAQTLDPESAPRFAPLVSKVDDHYFFWNYELEKEEAIDASRFPRALVTLRGEIRGDARKSNGGYSSLGMPEEMQAARLLECELLDERWLAEWALFFRDPASPFRIAKAVKNDAASRQAFGTAALAALRRMRKLPGPDAKQLELLRSIDPAAKPSERFRRGKELEIQRWLMESAKSGELELGDLSDLPPLPPSSTELQGLFLEAESLERFFAAVRTRWTGDLALLQLVHYEKNERSTWYESTPLDRVSEWSEEHYARCRAATRETLKR
ncbi:MAG: hypothetical protein JNM84_07750 [Planctomycetes bacterium]|nr:hypothetical protein [Planctomycetota bacterium]